MAKFLEKIQKFINENFLIFINTKILKMINMKKLTELTGINKYYCMECQSFHYRRYRNVINSDGSITKTKNTPFFNHSEYAYLLDSTELFKLKFKRNFRNYSIDKHQKSNGSKKQ